MLSAFAGGRSNHPEVLKEHSAGARKGRPHSLPGCPEGPSSKRGARLGVGGESASRSMETALILHHDFKEADSRRDLMKGWRQASSLRPGVKSLCSSSTQVLHGGAVESSCLCLRNSPDSNRSSRLPSEEAGAQSSLRARRKARGGGGGVSKPLARVVLFFFPLPR